MEMRYQGANTPNYLQISGLNVHRKLQLQTYHRLSQQRTEMKRGTKVLAFENYNLKTTIIDCKGVISPSYSCLKTCELVTNMP